MELQERVKNGAHWLDENFPDWASRINVETLDLIDGYHCVCGQVFRDEVEEDDGDSGYEWACNHLLAQANSWIPVDKDAPERSERVSEFLGFSLTQEECERNWEDNDDFDLWWRLTELWQVEVSERQKVTA